MFGINRILKWIIVVAVALIMIVVLIWQNRNIGVTRFTFTHRDLPVEMDGLRILHVSDLHNWDTKGRLMELAVQERPNVIFITGDLIDGRNTKVELALSIAKDLVQLAPVYYVQGNHEGRSSKYPKLRKGLQDLGVIVLEDQVAPFSWNGSTVMIGGLRDPSGRLGASYDGPYEVAVGTQNRLKNMMETSPEPILFLLAHRPERMEDYAQMGIPMVFSGHSHGGQIRIPFLGGLVAPNQGFLPEYDGGWYIMDQTQMVVSRGLGNSIFPLRIANPPELVLVECRVER